MTDPTSDPQRLERALGHLSRELEHDEKLAMLEDLHTRRARQSRRRMLMAAAALLLIAIGVSALTATPRSSPERLGDPPSVATTSPEPIERLSDGSELSPVTEGTTLDVVRESADRVEVAMGRGRARFEVTPNPARRFVVQAGLVRVEVLGTRFEVSHESDLVEVSVKHGRVRVTGPQGSYVLGAGERVSMQTSPAEPAPEEQPGPVEPTPEPSFESAPEPTPEPPPRSPVRRETSRVAPRPSRDVESWQSLASSGEYARAARALDESPGGLDPARASEYLLAADAMRHVKRPDRALEYLEHVERAHADSAQAPSAHFARGLILLQDRGRPAEAARAFEATRTHPRVSPSMAEDAMARQVEALERAGARERARALALEYLTRYPQGHRRAVMKRIRAQELP